MVGLFFKKFYILVSAIDHTLGEVWRTGATQGCRKFAHKTFQRFAQPTVHRYAIGAGLLCVPSVVLMVVGFGGGGGE